jgi:hypothetical protein
MLAGAARPWVIARAEQALAQPERQPLLANAGGSVQQQGTRQRVTAYGVVEPRAKCVVTVDGKQWHPRKVRALRGLDQCPGAARFVTLIRPLPNVRW